MAMSSAPSPLLVDGREQFSLPESEQRPHRHCSHPPAGPVARHVHHGCARLLLREGAEATEPHPSSRIR